ncbi:hypothetical protein [Phocaeicola plebeius]|uniref:hypothetical protein n=1 Tax=Phocaeicola plebeius TaxID=310297 RepID=UPI00307EBB7F
MSEETKKEIKEEKPLKTCFVIMPISDVDGYEKGHFDRVYKYLIKPACEAAGYKVDRADDTSKANMIIVDILQKAVKYDMAICDISSRNANVFYELGFRQAFNMKTVLIKDKKTVMPFDISSIRTLSYSETLRIDEVEKGRTDIQKALEETEKANSNDVNSLINLLSINKAEIPKQQELSVDTSIILNAINDLKTKENKKINEIYNINDQFIRLGDEVTFSDDNILWETAKLVGMDQKRYIVESDGEDLVFIDKDSKRGRSLSLFPF